MRATIRRASALRAAVMTAALSCAGGGCRYRATAVEVVMDTDAPVSRALRVRVTVRGAGQPADDGGGGETREWVRGGAPPAIALPASFTVAPGARGHAAEPVALVIDAELAAGGASEPALVFRRTARFRFTEHATTRLPVLLAVSCGLPAEGCTTVPPEACTASVRCEEMDRTCGDDARCVGVDVTLAPAEVPWTPDAAAPRDATVPDAPLDRVVEVTTGGFHSCARLASGSIRCWGARWNGQVGDGVVAISDGRPTAYQVPGLTGVVQVAAGFSHTCVLGDDHAVRCWGRNVEGQLGQPSPENVLAPALVAGTGAVVELVAGPNHNCARQTSGAVVCWGKNDHGQLGSGAISPADGGGVGVARPVMVAGITNAVQLSAGYAHTCARLAGGQLACWGRDDFGQLGDGAAGPDHPTPVMVEGVAPAEQIAAGTDFGCARFGMGAVSCWGNNDHGQLGAGSTAAMSLAPVAVGGLTDATQLAAGDTGDPIACARRANGAVACWGYNYAGAVGNGMTRTTERAPSAVVGLTDAVQVAVGGYFACALRAAGAVVCWGSNVNAELGTGMAGGQSATPAAVVGLP